MGEITEEYYLVTRSLTLIEAQSHAPVASSDTSQPLVAENQPELVRTDNEAKTVVVNHALVPLSTPVMSTSEDPDLVATNRSGTTVTVETQENLPLSVTDMQTVEPGLTHNERTTMGQANSPLDLAYIWEANIPSIGHILGTGARELKANRLGETQALTMGSGLGA